jgi:hypothetical protein
MLVALVKTEGRKGEGSNSHAGLTQDTVQRGFLRVETPEREHPMKKKKGSLKAEARCLTAKIRAR